MLLQCNLLVLPMERQPRAPYLIKEKLMSILAPSQTYEIVKPVISPAPPDNRSYVELKRLITEKGLLEKQPGFLTYKILLTAAMLTVSIIILFWTDNFWVQILNAIYMAFVFGQIG